jgi:hypothetical protein
MRTAVMRQQTNVFRRAALPEANPPRTREPGANQTRPTVADRLKLVEKPYPQASSLRGVFSAGAFGGGTVYVFPMLNDQRSFSVQRSAFVLHRFPILSIPFPSL